MSNHLLITGGEQGLGAGIVQHALALGWRVTNIEGRFLRHESNLRIAELIPSHHYTHVVNNYAINHLSWIGETAKDDADIMRVNVMVPYWIINELVNRGLECDVINISSQTYKVAQRTTSLYCASKAALVHMTKVMARELAPHGWRLNSLAPGKILGTEMSRLTDAQVLELRGWGAEAADRYALDNIPMGRFTTVGEVAEAVFSIFSMPAYVNGTCIDMTGGV